MSNTKRISAPQCVVEYIKKAIQDGELKPGDKLPKEAELSTIIGVGRSSLREGMRILSAYGIVEARQGDGTFIRDTRPEKAFDFLGLMPTKENLRHLQQLRYAIESSCFQIVFSKLDASDYKQISGYVDDLVSAKTLIDMIEGDFDNGYKFFQKHMRKIDFYAEKYLSDDPE